MYKLKKQEKDKLINILDDLITVLEAMRKDNNDYLLMQNECEAKEWLAYLKKYDGIEEIHSLKKEIVNRLVDRFDVEICESDLDDQRVMLMKSFIFETGGILKRFEDMR